MQGQGRRHIAHVIDLRPRRLRHPPPRIGGQRLQIPPRSLGIQHPQRQRALPRARHPGNPHDLPQGYIHVDILQIVRPCPAHLDTVLFHNGDKGTQICAHFLAACSRYRVCCGCFSGCFGYASGVSRACFRRYVFPRRAAFAANRACTPLCLPTRPQKRPFLPKTLPRRHVKRRQRLICRKCGGELSTLVCDKTRKYRKSFPAPCSSTWSGIRNAHNVPCAVLSLS